MFYSSIPLPSPSLLLDCQCNATNLPLSPIVTPSPIMEGIPSKWKPQRTLPSFLLGILSQQREVCNTDITKCYKEK